MATQPLVVVSETRTRVARVASLLNAHDARECRTSIAALSALPFGIARELSPDDIVSRAVTMIGDTPTVDVLTRARNVRWADANHEIAAFEVEGVPAPTISLALLVASKRTGRAQDVADLVVLEAIQSIRG